MLFNIWTQNFGSLAAVDSAAPIINYLKKTLSACGHDVTVEFDKLHSNAINLMFEDFIHEGLCQVISNIRREKGYRFGIIATELMQKEGIPYARHGISYGVSDNRDMVSDNRDMITRRLDGFAEVVKSVDFVWSFLPRTAHYLSEKIAISKWLPVGHTDNIAAELIRSPKNIDIFFFGKLTPHRKSVIDSLVDSGLKVAAVGQGFPHSGYVPFPLLGSLIERSKIALNLTLHAAEDSIGETDPRFVSCMRVLEYFKRNILVVSEDIPLDNPYKDFMISAPIGEMSTLCKYVLEEGCWKELGQQNSKNFRKAMDVREICLPVIEQTLVEMGV